MTFRVEEIPMKCKLAVRLLPFALVVALPASAQEPPAMTPEQQAEMEIYIKAGTPGSQHQAMAKAVGSYDLALKSWHAAGTPPMEEKGTATRSMTLDGRVLEEEVKANMMGQPFTGHGRQGFDNTSGKYWSTWNDTMSTGIMVAEGSCDAQRACTFTGTSIDPLTKKPTTMRMTSRWTNATTELFEMFGPGKDGKEFKMMEITYSKKS
jgi:hypothetical protein